MASARPTAYRRALIAILLAGAVLRLGVHLDLRSTDPLFDTPVLDSRVYLDSAERIAGGDVLGDRPFFMNPLYPYFLSPVVAVAGRDPLLAIRTVQMGLGLLTVLLTAAAARRLLGEGPALFAAGLAAAYPVLLFYEQTVMIATLAVFLNALALYVLARFSETRSRRAALVAGLALGFSVLARPNAALFAVLLPLWFLALAGPGRRLRFAGSRGALLLAGVLAVVLPVTFRNWLVGRDFVPVTSSMGFTLYESNNPAAWRGGWMGSGEFDSLPSELERVSHDLAEAGEGRPLKPSEASRYWVGRTFAEFRAHPGPAFGFLGRKLLFFLQSPEFPSSYHYGWHEARCAPLRAIPLSFGLLAPFAILGIADSVRRRPGARPFALLFAAYAVGLVLFFPLGHYRLPVLPATFALAAAGLFTVVRALRLRDAPGLRRCGVVLGGAVAVLALPTVVRAAGGGWPAGYEEGDRRYAFMQGQILAAHGRYGDAEACFLEARERGDDRWALGCAELELRRRRYEAAARRFHQVLRTTPALVVSVSDAAAEVFAAGHRPAGLELARAAAAAAPGEPGVHIRLGEILDASGRHPEALLAYEEGIRAAPGEPMVLVRIAERHERFGRRAAAIRLIEEAGRAEPR